MLAVKSLNNSLVLADDNGDEKIVMGKGLGFNCKAGQQIDPERVEKVFLPRQAGSLSMYERLAAEIPDIYFEITGDIMKKAAGEISGSLSDQLFIGLTDHISYAVERYQKGITLQNKLLWEVRAFYPTEFRVGCWAVELINRRVGVDLPEEEAGNIAYHIVNAQSDNLEVKDTIQSITMLKDILNIVNITYKGRLQLDSTHYYRMVTHLQFFLQRVLEDKMLGKQDAALYDMYVQRYPEEHKCIERIDKYIASQMQKPISIDEKFYLMVHLVRNVHKAPVEADET